MQPAQIIVTVLLTAVIVAAIIFATAISLFPGAAQAHGFSAAHGGWSMHRAGAHGRKGGAVTDDHCRRLDFPMARVAGVMIDEHLELNDNQRELLEPALGVVASWQSQTRSQCERLTGSDVDTGLDALEQILRISAQSVADLKPAYAAFHASLDSSQQEHLAQAMQNGSHH